MILMCHAVSVCLSVCLYTLHRSIAFYRQTDRQIDRQTDRQTDTERREEFQANKRLLCPARERAVGRVHAL